MSHLSGMSSHSPLFTLHEHSSAVMTCSFFPSCNYSRGQSNLFLSSDVAGTVILWNLLTRRCLLRFVPSEEARAQMGSLRSLSHEESGNVSDISTGLRGPHSSSVIALGFLLCSSASPPSRYDESSAQQSGSLEATLRNNFIDTVQVHSRKKVHSTEVSGVLSEAFPLSDPTTLSTISAPAESDLRRQRFRLLRRPLQLSTLTNNSTEIPSSSGSAAHDSPSPIFFFTQCRDQRLYVWSFEHPRNSCGDKGDCTSGGVPILIEVLTVPQNGFCPAAATYTQDGHCTFLALPHDADGYLSVWQFTKTIQTQTTGSLLVAPLDNDATVTNEVTAERQSTSRSSIQKAAEETASTMNAFMTLFAESEKQTHAAITLPRGGESSSSAIWQTGQHKKSTYCRQSPNSPLKVRLLSCFSASPRVKGGVIMRLMMCEDTRHIGVAFESGHISLCNFRDDGVVTEGGNSTGTGHVRCLLRAFPESALTCLWSGSTVLATSAEGDIHCYAVERVAPPSLLSTTAVSSTVATCKLSLQLKWSTRLRKGIGSIFLQSNLVVAGGWDSTLRLYDARDGRQLSIFAHHDGTVEALAVAPGEIAPIAPFGFDNRQPRCYVAPNDASAVASLLSLPSTSVTASSAAGTTSTKGDIITLDEENGVDPEPQQMVYLFASASKDATVALWRVDFGVLPAFVKE